jgi:hypothetical protein
MVQKKVVHTRFSAVFTSLITQPRRTLSQNIRLVLPLSYLTSKGTTMPEALPKCKLVTKHILECIRGGVGIRQICPSMQHLQNAPRSLSTLYKVYGAEMEAERAKINMKVGKRVIDQALTGDINDAITWKSQELFLRSKSGWSPQNTVNEVEQEVDPELDVSAADELMSLLGFNNEEEPEYPPED